MKKATDEIKRIKYLTKEQRYDDALREISILILDNPKDYRLQAYKAMILNRMFKAEEALDIIEDVISKTTNNEDKLFAYETAAIIHEGFGDYETAIYYRKRTIEMFPQRINVKSIVALSRMYYKTGKKDEALATLDSVNNFNSPAFNVSRAYIHYYDGEYEEALEALKRPISGDVRKDSRSTIDILYIKGLIKEKENKIEEALELYNQIFKQSDDKMSVYWDARYQAANIYYKQGNEDRAVKLCDEIIDKCRKYRDHVGACDLLATIYINRNEFDKAREVYERCIMPDFKSIGFARMAIVKGDFYNARHYLKDTDHLEFEKSFTRDYYYAVMAFRNGNYEEFKQYYDNCSRIINDDTVEYLKNLYKMLVSLETKNRMEHNHSLTYENYQIMNYDPILTLEHMKEVNEIEDIKDIYNIVADHLENPIIEGIYDKYIVDLKKIGYSDTKRHVEVLCLADTKNIVDIHKASEYIPGEDFKVKPVQKTKLSAIDKFNKKYGM